MKKYVVAILLLCPMVASANGPFSSSTVKGITMHDFGNQILVQFPAPLTHTEPCADKGTLVVEKTHPFFKEMFSALLSAFHAGTPIVGWVNGCNATFSPAC